MDGDDFRNTSCNSSGCSYINLCFGQKDTVYVPEASCYSDGKGDYNCTCEENAVGDGKINGTGCRSDSHVGLIAGSSTGGATLFVMIICLVFWRVHKKMQEEYSQEKASLGVDVNRRKYLEEIQTKEGANICRLFTQDELAKATDNFADNRVLGTGGFGTVFEGTLHDGVRVAIKRAHDVGPARDDTELFLNEVTILSQVNHRNLVALLGCCLETAVPILIYEFISHGNLMEHLRPKPAAAPCRSPLDWSKRLKIAVGTAEALTYLHSGTSPAIIRCDVMPANILLDDDYVAKVADSTTC